MDVSLAPIARLLGEEQARQVAVWAGYDWHDDPVWDSCRGDPRADLTAAGS